MQAGWIITKDHIADPDCEPGTYGNAVGVAGPRNITDEALAILKNGGGTKFEMRDDDGELYYEGRLIGLDTLIDHECDPLMAFGLGNAGATRLKVGDEVIY